MPKIDLCKIDLCSGGASAPPADGSDFRGCVEQAVAWHFDGEWTDRPKCVCPVIAAGKRGINDAWWPSDKERSKMLLPLIALHDAAGNCLLDADGFPLPGPTINTRSTREVERRRAYMAADWAVRVAAPIALRAHGRAADAERLEALGEIVDKASAAAAAAAAADDAAAAAAAAAERRWAIRKPIYAQFVALLVRMSEVKSEPAPAGKEE